LETIIDIRDNR